MSEISTTVITPVDVSLLTDEQIDTMLDGIRYRRMQAKVMHDETMKIKDMAARLKLEGMIESKCVKLRKAIEAVDVKLEKLEKVVNEVRALRLQLGDTEESLNA